MARPIVYMLCGFVSAGKTTYSRRLEAAGVRRLSIDERVYERHGRHGVDYPEAEYPRLEAEALVELDRELVDLVRRGESVVLDYGFWSRSMRDRYKRMIEDTGGQWRLIYLPADLDVIRQRLAERNRRTDANALRVSERMLDEFRTRWEPPEGEGEEILAPL